EFPDHFNLAAGDVSTYAMSEPAEYAAEAFTLSRLDPEALPDDARDIVEWIEARAAMQVGDRVPVLAAAGAHLDPDGTPTLLIVDMLHGDCVPVRYALGMLGQRPNTAAISGPAEIIREIPDKFIMRAGTEFNEDDHPRGEGGRFAEKGDGDEAV